LSSRSLAFLVPMLVRFIPEFMAWPYPIGFDTLIYADVILRGTYLKMGVAQLLKSTSLFYIFSSSVNIVFGNPILTLKFLAPMLFGLLCGSIYIYCRKALGWGLWKALAASLLTGTYFVSLRISWEMQRQILGFTFLFIALTAFRVRNVKWGMFATALSGFLTAWSHELAAVLFFAIMASHVIVRRGLLSKSLISLAAAPALLLFVYQRYNPTVGVLQIPSESFASASWICSASFILGFLLYLFLPLLPVALLGAFYFRGLDVWVWTATCLLFTCWPIFLPENSVVLWFRWAILLVYPVIFFAVDGLEKLWMWGGKHSWKLSVGRFSALFILLVNVALSSCYLAMPPEHQIEYFGEWNNYKQYIQTSMLQNTVSLADTQSVVEALRWIDERLAGNGVVLVLHEAIDCWAQIIVKNVKHVGVREADLSSQVRENAAARLISLADENCKNGSQVYTVWWVDGKGWYGMSQLPPLFSEVKRFGNIAVFKYQQET